MKNLLIGFVVLFLVAACDNNNNIDQDNIGDQETTEQQADTTSEVEGEEPEDDDIAITLGETFSIDDWDITLNSTDITDSISVNDFMSFTPDEGMRYLVFELTVKNNGTNADDFLPMFSTNSDMSMTVYYNEDFVYTPSGMLGHDDDLTTSSRVNPLAEKTGVVAFNIPESVLDSDDSLKLTFNKGSEERVYHLR